MHIDEIRHGSNALDSSSSTERDSPVILSEAKDLSAYRARPFASLRVTQCDCSTCQGLFFTIEPYPIRKYMYVCRKTEPHPDKTRNHPSRSRAVRWDDCPVAIPPLQHSCSCRTPLSNHHQP